MYKNILTHQGKGECTTGFTIASPALVHMAAAENQSQALGRAVTDRQVQWAEQAPHGASRARAEAWSWQAPGTLRSHGSGGLPGARCPASEFPAGTR